MSNQKNRVTLTVVGLFAMMALVLGFFISEQINLKHNKDRSQFHGTLLENPRDVNGFELTGIDHAPFNNASLQGHWTMVFFGFTSCGSICPITMAELGKMYQLLEEKKVKTLPEVVMVSLDPDRDSLAKLEHYVHVFNPHFFSARGDEEAVAEMTHEMGIVYAKIAHKGSEDAQSYDIEHTGTVMLFNPQGKLSAFFTTPHHSEQLAQDYQLLVS